MRILNILYLRRYGTTAYIYIKGPEHIQLRKLAPRAKKRRLVSYKGNNSYIYCVQILTKNKIIQLRNIIFNKALDLPIAILENKFTIQEPEPELLLKPQALTTIIVTIVTYPTIKALEEKEYRIEELEGLHTPNLVLGELGLKG